MMHRIKVAATGIVAAALATALAACSPAGSGSSGSSGSKSSGGTFVVARTGDVDKLDPQLATAFQTIETLGLVYSTLVTTDNSGTIVPGLASKWTTSADGKTVTFTLRTGVKFQDGTPFSSADVKASLERILDQKTGAVARSNLLAIQTVDAPDAATVVLHLAAPSAGPTCWPSTTWPPRTRPPWC
jgi:peptide/nickel transport system substrate-binding protein